MYANPSHVPVFSGLQSAFMHETLELHVDQRRAVWSRARRRKKKSLTAEGDEAPRADAHEDHDGKQSCDGRVPER